MPKEIFNFEQVLKKTQHKRHAFLSASGPRSMAVGTLSAITGLSNGFVVLTWETPAVTFSTGYYNLFRNGHFLTAVDGGQESYFDGTTSPGGTYTYRLEFYFTV